MIRTPLAAILALAGLAAVFPAPTGAAPLRVEGEASRTPVRARLAWKSARYPASSVARLRYPEMPARRLLDLQRRNAAGRAALKATQIGLPRSADLEGRGSVAPMLRWQAVPGGYVARFEVRSADALAVRVGLQAGAIPDGVELRFAGSDAPDHVVAALGGRQIARLVDRQGVFWTPSTDGEAQTIEVFRPAKVAAGALRLRAPLLSHLVTNSRNDFKLLEKIGESGSCNIDTECRVGELGTAFVNAKDAVAHMQFVLGGGTYICSGTLLEDTTGSTQVPYFYTANHCFSSDTSRAPIAAEMQSVASTLNTFWGYEATGCGSGVSKPRTQLAGGAAYLYSDHLLDAMLLRLNDPAPAGAFFAGWTAEPLAEATEAFAIHHPRGDAKKVSRGQVMGSDSHQHAMAWTQGTTEGGSSGSGLFTRTRGGFMLRGGLYGGAASCANSGSTSNTANRDYYSRFDLVLPQVVGYLAAEAVAENGSAPLLPPATAPAAAAPASAPAAASAGTSRRPTVRAPARRLPVRRTY